MENCGFISTNPNQPRRAIYETEIPSGKIVLELQNPGAKSDFVLLLGSPGIDQTATKLSVLSAYLLKNSQ